MPSFNGGNGGTFTPSTSADNYTLDMQSAGVVARVVRIGWGGRLTTSTGYRTRWARPSVAGSSTFTSLNPEASNPNYATPGARLGTFASAATLPSDPKNLHAQDWNAQGGGGVLELPIDDPWLFVFGAATQQLSCRNVAGTDANASSYIVSWRE